MVYNIERKADLSGVVLTVRFPEQDLDQKALYTIEHDPPAFLVPFSYRKVDGMIECTYRPENRSKLQYRFGTHSVEEYVDLWEQILHPLLDCEDWFLNPFCFVLRVQELYVDKNSSNICYLYVPSRQTGTSLSDVHSFVMELSQQNSVTDAMLENKVLRMMMQDFQPKSFLEMLHSFQPQPQSQSQPVRQAPEARERPVPEEREKRSFLPEKLRPVEEPPQPKPPQGPAEPPRQPIAAGDDDIMIHFPSPEQKAEKKRKPLFGGGKKKEKAVKEKEHKPLFGAKKEVEQEIVLGAAADRNAAVRQESRPLVSYEDAAEDAVTQVGDEMMGQPCLRLAGPANMPREILVNIEPGRMFTIGRFDVSVGRQQSSFEFPKETRAVSRRHAAIEREVTGEYAIVDLASSAGTFVDGERLVPNVPHPIFNGSRVSFGTGGADYVWNE